jgi:hypothetical protein
VADGLRATHKVELLEAGPRHSGEFPEVDFLG